MVVLFDLEDDDEAHFPNRGHHPDHDAFRDLPHQLTTSLSGHAQPDVGLDERMDPNVNASFTKALNCYPFVAQLASFIDLNTLHNLSRTCRQFRVTLLQNRSQLINQTLRCSNEDKAPSATLADRFRESHGAWTGSGLAAYNGRITTGKIGRCATDMVGECRRCGVVVCRNCTTKPPPSNLLNGRFRRICGPCHRAPITLHTTPPAPKPPILALISSSPPPSSSPRTTPSPEPPLSTYTLTPVSSRESIPPAPAQAFTSEAFARTPCTCDTSLWLCTPCGRSLRSDDTAYARSWTWRTRYTTYLGGLGTGIGEGNEGVACGRGSGCLAAHTVEQEVDLSPSDSTSHNSSSPDAHDSQGVEGRWRGGSWGVQEIEGVGGGLRRKMKRLVRVGCTVREFEDEREGGCEVLWREKGGDRRSWCAWCERVVGSREDVAARGEG